MKIKEFVKKRMATTAVLAILVVLAGIKIAKEGITGLDVTQLQTSSPTGYFILPLANITFSIDLFIIYVCVLVLFALLGIELIKKK